MRQWEGRARTTKEEGQAKENIDEGGRKEEGTGMRRSRKKGCRGRRVQGEERLRKEKG